MIFGHFSMFNNQFQLGETVIEKKDQPFKV